MAKCQGWTKPNGGARKFHYFMEGDPRSLCQKLMILRPDPEAFEDAHHDHKENCAACRKELYRRLEKEDD